MDPSKWLKENAPAEIVNEIQENFQFALEEGVQAMQKIREAMDLPKTASAEEVFQTVRYYRKTAERLDRLINNPHTQDFLESVRLEAAHQREKWGTEHDEGKQPEDWLFLMGYLGTKACQSHREYLSFAAGTNQDKALHHTISTAAACLNWHAAIVGESSTMRPGIKKP